MAVLQLECFVEERGEECSNNANERRAHEEPNNRYTGVDKGRAVRGLHHDTAECTKERHGDSVINDRLAHDEYEESLWDPHCAEHPKRRNRIDCGYCSSEGKELGPSHVGRDAEPPDVGEDSERASGDDCVHDGPRNGVRRNESRVLEKDALVLHVVRRLIDDNREHEEEENVLVKRDGLLQRFDLSGRPLLHIGGCNHDLDHDADDEAHSDAARNDDCSLGDARQPTACFI